MRNILFIFVLFLSINTLNSQSISIINGVLSTPRGKEIPFANITIRRQNSSDILQGTVSDEYGKFEFLNLEVGYYNIQSFFVGYKPFSKDSIWVAEGINKLDTLKMRRKATELDEITVVSEKSVVENHPGMVVYNVDAGANMGENALDVFKNIPSLGIDMDNNVTLKGAKATILIDGVESDLADMLDQLPSNVVSSIEVISNPSAKYDSKNGGGIINIKLKNDKLSGYNHKFILGYGLPERYTVNANSSIRSKNWNFGLSTSLKEDPKEDYRTTNRSVFSEKGNKYLHQNQHNLCKQNTFFIRGNLRYQSSKRSNISFQCLYQVKKAPLISKYTSQTLNNDSVLTNFTNNKRDEANDRALLEFSSVYRKTFKKSKDNQLSVRLKYSTTKSTLDYIRTSQPYDIVSNNKKSSYSEEIRTGDDKNKSAFIKVDYEHPIKKRWKLELGGVLNYRYFEQDKLSERINYINPEDIKNRKIQDVSFKLDELKPGAYAVINGSKGKYSFSAGLRYEIAQINEYIYSLDSAFSTNLSTFSPSLMLEKKISKKYTWGISYTRREKIPSYRQLTPISLNFGGYYRNTGNPNLKKQQTQTVDFNHHLLLKKATLNGALFFNHISNLIGTYYSFEEEDGKTITSSQADNLGSMANMGLEVSASLPWNKFVFRPSITAYYKTLIGGKLSQTLDKEQLYAMFKLSANYAVNKRLSFQINGNYNGTDISVQGKRFNFYMINLAAKYKVMNGNGLLSLKVNDIFDSNKFDKLINQREDQINETNFNMETQYVYLAFSYKFSSLKNK